MTMAPRSTTTIAHWAAPLLLLGVASAQDGPDPQELNPFGPSAQEASPRDRMIELFHEVERRMGRSTQLLFDASKGDTSQLAEVGESGLDDLRQEGEGSPAGDPRAALAGLLDASRGEGREVLRAIDEILEIAESQGGGS